MAPFPRSDRHLLNRGEEPGDLDDLRPKGLEGEVPVAVADGRTLGEDKVVGLQTEGDDGPRFAGSPRDLDRDQPVLPSRWGLRGLGPDPVGVVAEGRLN